MKLIIFVSSELHKHVINGSLQDYDESIKHNITVLNNKDNIKNIYDPNSDYVIISFYSNNEFYKQIKEEKLIHYYTTDVIEYATNNKNILFQSQCMIENIKIIINYYFYNEIMFNNKHTIHLYETMRNNKKFAIDMLHNELIFGNILFIINKINNTNNIEPSNIIRVYDFDKELRGKSGSFNANSLIDNIYNENNKTMVTYESKLWCSLNSLENEIIIISKINNKKQGINTEIYFDTISKIIKQTIIGDHDKVINLWEKIKKDERHSIIHFNITENYKIIYGKLHIDKTNFIYKRFENYTKSNQIRISRKRELSKGGQSKILIAYDNNVKDTVILKEYDHNKTKHALMREYNILKKLPSHANIISCPSILNERTLIFNKTYPTDYRHYIDNLIVSKTYLPIDYVLYVIKKMIDVGHHLKQNNVLHLDYKTENVCFSDDGCGEPILIDFGNAINIDNINTIEKSRGTLHYMSPEILYGKSKNDEKTDVWSLGIFFLEILINDLPWDNIKSLNPTKLYKILQNKNAYEYFKETREKDDCDIIQNLFSFMLNIEKEKRYNFDQLKIYIDTHDIQNNFKNYTNLVTIISRIKAMNDIRYSIDV